MTKTLFLSETEFDYLLSPNSVRERSKQVFSLAEEGKTHFKLHLDSLENASQFVLDLIHQNYPDLQIPFHSRWEHFQAGPCNRIGELNSRLSPLKLEDRVKSKLDLVIVSVLLDAGAGANWKYRDSQGKEYSRSEGLAVASFDMFKAGLFSSDPHEPYRVDAVALETLELEELEKGFQVAPGNPMVGVQGRLSLLKKLGRVISGQNEFFGGSTLRPGNLLDHFKRQSVGGWIQASQILRALLLSLGDMWPERIRINGVNFGDLWTIPELGSSSYTQLISFHKLSQWLSYSLIEPLMESGLQVTGSEKLTGLPEYRNGGLFLDLGVLELKDKSLFTQTHSPDSPLIVEWRALTVTLLDEVATLIRKNLNMNEETLPLGKVLQGGTWLAGRVTAQKMRGGLPPFQLDSDGTIF